MDLGEHSANNSVPVSSSCRKLRKFFNAVLPIVRLRKLMKRLCVNPAAVEISTIPRKLQEKLNPENLKLQFSNNVCGPIYTGLPIGDQEGNPLDLHLIDCSNQNIMNCGAEASAEVEILVLEKDFTRYIGGEKSLIRGNPQVSLKNGSVSVSHISFKHTRNSLKKRELRLCARVVYPFNRIVDAVTKPFFVKDRRSMGKSLKPLILDDQVWKLQTIRKDGPFHKRLMKENIETVQDFLTHYFLNRENLLSILGRHMNVKKLDAAVNQAKSKLELKRYVYRQENLRVVFTDVGELIGVQFCKEGHSFSFQQLVQELKAFATQMVKNAFQNGRQNFKVLLDDDSFYNGFTSEEAYNYVIDTQQRQPVPNNNNVANYMPNTSLKVNNYDNISQLNGALPHQFHPDDNDIIDQYLPSIIWD
ncbi:calmodulin-binding protein 60 A-like [Solanum pennellii]|uniref:Calmodulin-binding protein 60 A-like n=1 Tax=Solanum pennellii TaxID=28526 RepID=A0ABM1GAK9_SOLPN|nr:calmodulin-binding protein 60 A-like [Solanum pennellii]